MKGKFVVDYINRRIKLYNGVVMNTPKIEPGKIVSVCAQKSTGIILNNDGSFYLNSGDNYFSSHDDITVAIKHVNAILSDRNDMEVILYDHLGNFSALVGVPVEQ